MGLTFAELNELRAQDLVDLLHHEIESMDSGGEEIVRDATQSDIDRFFM